MGHPFEAIAWSVTEAEQPENKQKIRKIAGTITGALYRASNAIEPDLASLDGEQGINAQNKLKSFNTAMTALNDKQINFYIQGHDDKLKGQGYLEYGFYTALNSDGEAIKDSDLGYIFLPINLLDRFGGDDPMTQIASELTNILVDMGQSANRPILEGCTNAVDLYKRINPREDWTLTPIAAAKLK